GGRVGGGGGGGGPGGQGARLRGAGARRPKDPRRDPGGGPRSLPRPRLLGPQAHPRLRPGLQPPQVNGEIRGERPAGPDECSRALIRPPPRLHPTERSASPPRSAVGSPVPPPP